MRVESIKLENFRNYEDLELTFDKGTNIFYGDNAQGKTNILEAVYVAGTTKSHRGTKDREMIRFGCDEGHIRMNIVKNEVPYRIDMHLKKNRSKGIAINGVPIRRASELLGLGNYVFFSPEDLNIIKDGPSERRRFLDMELCQLSSAYVHSLTGYNKVLMQRNKLLKDIGFRRDLEPTLDIWDEQLVNYGRAVIEARERFAQELSEIASEVHTRLSGGRELLRVGYEKSVSAEEFADSLAADRDRDMKYHMTHSGPHRDDLSFSTETIDIRKFGSQGQQRTTALSLKLAEIELVRRVSGDMPVLLLDDVLSELDSRRQHFLLESIAQIQTMITCTGVEDFLANQFRIDRLFKVTSGTLQEDINGREL